MMTLPLGNTAIQPYFKLAKFVQWKEF